MIRSIARLAATVALPAVLWGCASPNVDYADAQAHYESADYFQAFQSIERARTQAPDDPEIERIYWKMRQAYLLWDAQRLVFANDEAAAMERLEKVLALDPENEIALRWRRKALVKLAERAVDEGDRLVAGGDLQEALVAYDRALQYEAGNVRAREGIEMLGEVWRKTQEQAKGRFIDGVRALGDYEYRQTRWHLGIAIEKDPTLSEARDPLQVASRRLGQERFADAQRMEDEGYYRSALREYETIAELYPDQIPDLDERIERARIEAEVADLADAGEIAVYRGEFEKARELLDRAMAMTSRQKDAVAERLLMARERELENSYLRAKDLELQHLLEDAAVAYAELEEGMPGFRDVRARLSDLQIRIEEAQSAYEAGVEAEARGEIDAAIEAFTDVQLFWQGYQDSRARLDALRATRRASSGSD